MIKEKLEDLTFLYLYVKEFAWTTTMQSEMYMGHPRVGEVYRGVYNRATGNYKIFLPTEGNRINTFVFNSLEVTGDECAGKIYKITKSNIVTLNLRIDQLDAILEWMEKDNVDVKNAIQPKQTNQIVGENIVRGLASLREAMDQMGAGDVDARRRADEKMAKLYLTNTSLFELVLELVDELHEYDMARLESPHLLMAVSEEGKGINIQQALIHIEDYMGPVKAGGEDRESLFGAVINLMVELERRDVNELD